jgi:hypothetical protein
LASVETDTLPFTKIVESRVGAGGVVEEVLVPVAGRNEAEPFIADETFDRAGHGRHGNLLDIRLNETLWRGGPIEADTDAEAGRRRINAGWLTWNEPQYT